jgi:hypothetical protein
MAMVVPLLLLLVLATMIPDAPYSHSDNDSLPYASCS